MWFFFDVRFMFQAFPLISHFLFPKAPQQTLVIRQPPRTFDLTRSSTKPQAGFFRSVVRAASPPPVFLQLQHVKSDNRCPGVRENNKMSRLRTREKKPLSTDPFSSRCCIDPLACCTYNAVCLVRYHDDTAVVKCETKKHVCGVCRVSSYTSMISGRTLIGESLTAQVITQRAKAAVGIATLAHAVGGKKSSHRTREENYRKWNLGSKSGCFGDDHRQACELQLRTLDQVSPVLHSAVQKPAHASMHSFAWHYITRIVSQAYSSTWWVDNGL